MSSVDNRVVDMQFNNTQFENGVKTSTSSLQKLQQALKLQGSAQGLDDVNSAAGRMNLGGIADGVQKISDRFNAMHVVAYTVISDLTSRVLNFSIDLAKSFTLEPITAGLESYEGQINSMQTIIANTGAPMQQVTDTLAELQKYANQTVYSFSDMTQNIGTFTAAGVDLKTATSSIKGIANLAALSGANSQQAGSAMYQLSQAIAAGTVKLQDWNSVVNAGLGGTGFQKALETTARATGVNIDAIIKKAGSFRNSLQEGWLSSDILTKTLSAYTGDLSEAQLTAMGYTKQEAEQMMTLGKNANASATNIRTLTQMSEALKEEVATAYGQIFITLLGGLTDSTKLFTGLHNTLENMLTQPIYQLNTFLKAWVALGGRTQIISTIETAWKNLNAILGTVKKAFQEIFPPATAKQLFSITTEIQKFVSALTPSTRTLNELQRTFAGVFAVIDIGVQIIKGIISVFAQLFGAATGSSGGILDLTATIGDWLVKVDQAIKKGDGLTKFFQVLGSVLKIPIELIGNFAQTMQQAFDAVENFNGSAFISNVGKMSVSLEPFERAGSRIAQIWSAWTPVFQTIWNKVQPILSALGEGFINLAKSVNTALQNGDWNAVLDTFNTGFLGVLVLAIRRFFKKGFKLEIGGGFMSSISEAFEGLTNVLGAMQAKIKAETLIKIAAAVAVLTASVVALSLINSERLASALAGITVMFSQLAAGMAVMSKIDIGKTGLSMTVLSVNLTILAGAIDILSASVVALGHLDWNQITKGLTGVTVILGELVAVTKTMGKSSTLLGASVGLTALAGAVAILSGAVAVMGSMSWVAISKGLSGVAAGLVVMVAAINFMPKNPLLVASAAALILIGVALGELAGAMKIIGTLSWNDIGKGMTVIAGGLTLMVAALAALSATTGGVGAAISAAAILIVSTALVALAGALKIAGSMSWVAIAKSMVVLAGALLILAAGMIAMIPALPGAVALTAISAALAIFVPILAVLGVLPWKTIGSGLLALASSFALLAVAGVALLPAIPGLLGLGVAIGLLGVGIGAAAAGVAAFTLAMVAFGAAGPVAAAGINAMLDAIIAAIPNALRALATGITNFIVTLAQDAGQMATAMGTLLGTLLGVINKYSPQIIQTMFNLIGNLVSAIGQHVGQFASEGVEIMVNLLNGISSHLGALTAAGANLIIRFINAMSTQMGRIASAGEQAVINFINSIANGIRSHQGEMNAAGLNLAEALIDGMTGGLASKAGSIATSAWNLGKQAIDALKNAVDSHSPSKEAAKVGGFVGDGLSEGMDASADSTQRSAANMGTNAMIALKKSVSNVASTMFLGKDMTPVIRPVLDLTQVQKDSTQINGMLAPQPIQIKQQYATASTIAATSNSSQVPASTDGVGNSTQPATVVFQQTNTSPKALSTAEIYRQTKNQISTMKEKLKIT